MTCSTGWRPCPAGDPTASRRTDRPRIDDLPRRRGIHRRSARTAHHPARAADACLPDRCSRRARSRHLGELDRVTHGRTPRSQPHLRCAGCRWRRFPAVVRGRSHPATVLLVPWRTCSGRERPAVRVGHPVQDLPRLAREQGCRLARDDQGVIPASSPLIVTGPALCVPVRQSRRTLCPSANESFTEPGLRPGKAPAARSATRYRLCRPGRRQVRGLHGASCFRSPLRNPRRSGPRTR